MLTELLFVVFVCRRSLYFHLFVIDFDVVGCLLGLQFFSVYGSCVAYVLWIQINFASSPLPRFLATLIWSTRMSPSVRTFHRFIGIPPSTYSTFSAKAFAEFHRANRSAVIRKFKLRKVQESFSCSNQISHLVSSGPWTHSSGFGEVNISVAMKARKNEQEQIKLICRHVQWLGCLLVYADVETFN